jgi:predicted dehydrogenase
MPQTPPAGPTRRTFIQSTAAGVAAAAVARTSFAQAQPQDNAVTAGAQSGKQVRFAIMGLGELGLRQIIPAFKDTKIAKLTALVSGHPDKAKKTAEENGVDPKNIYNYDNFDKIKDNDQVDVVYVVLPNNMHSEFVVRAANAGKHVLCEKPFDVSAEKCQAAIDACKKNNRKLQIGYRLMYEPNNLALVDTVAKKECGELRIIEAGAGFSIGDPRTTPSAAWRLKQSMAGGGCLMDIGIYALSAARYITREEPVEVQAMTYANRSDPRFTEVEETCNFQLRFPSGVIANCTSSYSVGMNRYRALCTRGWAEVEPALSYRGVKFRKSPRGGRPEEPELGDPNQFATEMDALAQCILEDKQPKASGEQGLRDVRIMRAIYEAAETGKTIKLS